LAPGNYVLLSVTDTGQGMTPETLNRIYEPFFSTKENTGGTGLGLATVYGIVKQSGGTIHVYSEPGQGTIFKVYLPAAEAKPEPRQESSSGSPSRQLGGNERILVVDDMDQVRKVTAAILAQRGYQVLEAKDGIEAQEVIKKQDSPVQVLVTDLVMPKMGGRDLAQAMRTRLPDLKVVFISGYGENGVNHNGDLPGGLFLMKPFTAVQLLEKVRTVLDG
jgi:CheY-like chemotaxis protein